MRSVKGLKSGTGYKINEVADLCGFASQTNFGRNFQQQFGMPPAVYVAQKQSDKGK
ncbi:helix-turn-helix domain-containing protein [Chitinophaga niastensis]|uniref:helix-turn-helix domain-containing protein n=1 Tax=Chitinophaga niastensis TaxID=536980 RepID=UPI000D0DECF5